jgi:membrane-bound lytic murein transglycosylase B
MWRRAGRMMRRPAFGVVVIAPLVLIGAVGASAPVPKHAVSADGYTPLAAVASTGGSQAGATVVAAPKPFKPLHIAAANGSPPPPPIVMAPVGSMRIPIMALNAYRNAERMMASAYPGCGVSWNLLAGIGRIESLHANGGATDASGTPIRPIYGPTLDGTLAGNEVIVQSVQAGRLTYARAMGPMQFLPGTWARYASDGDGDGKADVQNLFDSTLAAARYLCSGNLNLRDQSQVLAAILRYNNSVAYARNVLGWAAAYATGVEPVDLPPISGPPPPISDMHLDARPEGLGPGLPFNATGLPASDPLAVTPLFDIGQVNAAGQIGVPGASPGPLPGPSTSEPRQNCQVFCFQSRTPAPQPGALPPGLSTPAPAAAPLPPAAPALPLFPPPPPPPPPPPAPLFVAPAPEPPPLLAAAPAGLPTPAAPPVN